MMRNVPQSKNVGRLDDVEVLVQPGLWGAERDCSIFYKRLLFGALQLQRPVLAKLSAMYTGDFDTHFSKSQNLMPSLSVKSVFCGLRVVCRQLS